MGKVIYIIGFILVLAYLLFGLDDIIWDFVTFFRKRKYRKKKLKLSELENVTPKMMAIMIGCWHEDNVIKGVIENIIVSTSYPISMYHIFIGVYPNDKNTIKEVEILCEHIPNVHMVMNEVNGPTSKAQNINYVIKEIKKYERANNVEFQAFIVHDSEDVVHPYELLTTNYMIDEHDAIQFPVFPIIRKPKFGNFFKNITTNTYADEFAENHYGTLVGRYVAGGFVPSAGTGFALSRKTILSFGNEDVLSSDSLTEDYLLSLNLYEKGIQMYYILEKIPRVDKDLKVRYDYITTRSLFPNTFRNAVKQKTRWIYGITMQSAKFRKIFEKNGMNFAGRYTLYKDLKAKYGNLIILLGYAVMIYWILSLFINLPPVYSKGSLSFYLCIVVTIMTIIRQIHRAYAIYNVYGFKSMFFACFFPPLFPIRLVYGNIINLVATIRAFNQKFTINKEKKRIRKKYVKEHRKVYRWAHTSHEFLDISVLQRYHRRLGDTLLMKELLTTEVLLDELYKASLKNERIGVFLLKNKIITEEDLMDALAVSHNRVYLDYKSVSHVFDSSILSKYNTKFLNSNNIIPIISSKNTTIFGICSSTPYNIDEVLKKKYRKNVYLVYLNKRSITKLFDAKTDNKKFKESIKLFKDNKLTCEQLLLVVKYSIMFNKTEKDTINDMGIKLIK